MKDQITIDGVKYIRHDKMKEILEKSVEIAVDYFHDKICGVRGCCGTIKDLTTGSDGQYSWTESECDVCHRRTKEVRNF